MVHRKGEDVVTTSAPDRASFEETARLLGPPKNAERLLAALARARAGEGETLTLEQLYDNLGIEREK
jgi:antitoxin YefM